MDDAVKNDDAVPISRIRDIASRELSTATAALCLRRYEKVRRNLAKEDRASQPRKKRRPSRSAAASKALDAVGTLNVPAVVMPASRMLPMGIQWIRARMNVRLPESFVEEAFVPYLGESDEHLRSSSKLAKVLFDGESDQEDDSDVEGMEIDSSSEDDDEEEEEDEDSIIRVHSPPSEANRHASQQKSQASTKVVRKPHRQQRPTPRQRNNTTIRKGSAQYPRAGKLYAYEGKVSEYRWERAAKRIALKRVASAFRSESTSELKIASDDPESEFARAVREAFCMDSPKHVRAYLQVVRKREELWDKKDKGDRQLDSMRTEVVNIAKGVGANNVGPTDVLKGDSIQFFFCRRCYVYDCSLHGCQTAGPIVTIPDRTRKDSAARQVTESIESQCDDRWTGDCYVLNQTESESEPSLGPDVHALLDIFLPIFGEDFCRVAVMVRSFLVHTDHPQLVTCNRVGHIANKTYPSLLKKPFQSRSKPFKARAPTPLMESKAMNGGTRPEYVPCVHSGPCTKSNCSCVQFGVHCEKYCGCNHVRPNQSRMAPLCNWAFPGCSCKSAVACASKACLCFSWQRECDPDLCRNCHECNGQEDEDICCQNVGLRRKKGHRILAGRSDVHGWGVYASDDISRNHLVGEYVGEVLGEQHAERRGRVYDEISSSYLFEITNNLALDSTRIGNKLRYCNHNNNPNCEPRLMRVGGDIRIGIFAKREISKHEELFFNYGEKFTKGWVLDKKGKAKRSKPKSQDEQSVKRLKRRDDTEEEHVSHRTDRQTLALRRSSTPAAAVAASSKAASGGLSVKSRRASASIEQTAAQRSTQGSERRTLAVRPTGRAAPSSSQAQKEATDSKPPRASKAPARVAEKSALGSLCRTSAGGAIDRAGASSSSAGTVELGSKPNGSLKAGGRETMRKSAPGSETRTLSFHMTNCTAPGSSSAERSALPSNLGVVSVSNEGVAGGKVTNGALSAVNQQKRAPWDKLGSGGRKSEKGVSEHSGVARTRVAKVGVRRVASPLPSTSEVVASLLEDVASLTPNGTSKSTHAGGSSVKGKQPSLPKGKQPALSVGNASLLENVASMTPNGASKSTHAGGSSVEGKPPSSTKGKQPVSSDGNRSIARSEVINLLSDDDTPGPDSGRAQNAHASTSNGGAGVSEAVQDGNDSDGSFSPNFGKYMTA